MKPHRVRPGSRRHAVRLYLKQGSVEGHGIAAAGLTASVELVGFSPARTTPGNILELAGELLKRTHLAGSVRLVLRDTDPSAAANLAYLLRCVGVPTSIDQDARSDA